MSRIDISTDEVRWKMIHPAAQELMRDHEAWWSGRGSLITRVQGVPLGDLWLPLADGTTACKDMMVTPEILDTDALAGEWNEPGLIEIEGRRFRTKSAFTRIPWVEAALGASVKATITGGSMRTLSDVKSISQWMGRIDNTGEQWIDLLKNMTGALVERSGGTFAVTHTLMRGPSDLAEAVLGPELMTYSMFDDPALLHDFLESATRVFVDMLRVQESIIPEIEAGSVNPFGIWAPGRVVRTQCDASAILSPIHYRDHYLPFDRMICEEVDFSAIHLHSVSLHVVPALLEERLPHAIQITIEDESSGPSLQDLVPTVRKILDVRPAILEGPLTDDELDYLVTSLPNDGLCINARRGAW